jgi:hypothetical protein
MNDISDIYALAYQWMLPPVPFTEKELDSDVTNIDEVKIHTRAQEKIKNLGDAD